jgi:hypothetical protein
MIGALPETLTVNGVDYPIRTDYRNVLQVFEAFQDPELEPQEKWIVAIYLLFEEFSCADDVMESAQNGFDLEEAMKQISWFISAGQPEKQVLEQPTYNWTQDEQMIFSAVNKVAGRETRELEYLHWWTFLGYFNEVGEGTFSFIVGIRNKLNKGKKLEKHEKEYLSHNKELVLMKKPLTKEEQEQEDAYKSLLDEVLG